MTVSFTWLGHSAFDFDINGHSVLVDPFLTHNPLASTSADSLNPEFILLSHAHDDHLGDTVDIAKRTGATVISNFEIGNWLANQGVQNLAQLNPGGSYRGEFFSTKLTIAHHSSSFPDGSYGGQPNGIVISTPELNLYFAGDTCVFFDMQLIGDMGIDVAFLPIGDTFTMGPDESIKAIEFVRPRLVVPMHYNTFPPIMQDAGEWAGRVNNETAATPIVLDPDKSYTVS